MRAYKKIALIAAALVPVNFALFGVKLYIGLASNSIAIYSDGVNNLFDALSLGVTAAALYFSYKKSGRFLSSAARTETLFTFLISLVIAGTGLYFIYNALERFFYPAPVWYTNGYLFVLLGSVGVKLALFFALRRPTRRYASGVLRAAGRDSLTDALITVMTALTLLISNVGGVSFDAVFGFVIGLIITVSAVRQIISTGRALTDTPAPGQKGALEELLASLPPETGILRTTVSRAGDETLCFVTVRNIPQNAQTLQSEASDTCGVTLIFVASEKED